MVEQLRSQAWAGTSGFRCEAQQVYHLAGLLNARQALGAPPFQVLANFLRARARERPEQEELVKVL